MKVYKSAVDSWLAMILVGTPLVIVGTGILLIRESQISGLMMSGIGILFGILIGLFTIPCKYTVSEGSLEIRCGILKEKIELEEIQKLSLSSNPLSAPALSLKRIRIDLVKGYRLISPKDREEFVRDITGYKH